MQKVQFNEKIAVTLLVIKYHSERSNKDRDEKNKRPSLPLLLPKYVDCMIFEIVMKKFLFFF